MALASATATNATLAGLAGQNPSNQIPWGSLHTATTSTTGASENPSTGSYARQASTWGTPSSGSMTNSASESYSTAGSTAVTYFGQWSASTAGTFGIGGALTSSVTAATITFASGAKSISSS
jgi:hypothetical protein